MRCVLKLVVPVLLVQAALAVSAQQHSTIKTGSTAAAAAQSPCITAPTAPECSQFTYPQTSAAADIGSLCGSMFYMASCSVAKACNASGAGPDGNPRGPGAATVSKNNPDICDPFQHVTTVCKLDSGMGGMSGEQPAAWDVQEAWDGHACTAAKRSLVEMLVKSLQDSLTQRPAQDTKVGVSGWCICAPWARQSHPKPVSSIQRNQHVDRQLVPVVLFFASAGCNNFRSMCVAGSKVRWCPAQQQHAANPALNQLFCSQSWRSACTPCIRICRWKTLRCHAGQLSASHWRLDCSTSTIVRQQTTALSCNQRGWQEAVALDRFTVLYAVSSYSLSVLCVM